MTEQVWTKLRSCLSFTVLLAVYLFTMFKFKDQYSNCKWVKFVQYWNDVEFDCYSKYEHKSVDFRHHFGPEFK